METKKYKFSMLRRVLYLGLRKWGANIQDGNLILPASKLDNFPLYFSKKILISDIEKITCRTTVMYTGKGVAPVNIYTIFTKNNGKFSFPYSMLDAKDFQNLLNELKLLKPNIEFSEKVLLFLQRNILEKRRLRFDFVRHEGQWFKIDKELSQDYPSLDAFMGLTIVLSFILIPTLFGFFGNSYFYDFYGRNYPIYRNTLVVFSGVSFTISLVNVFMALTSQYLGHRITAIFLALSAIFLLIGIL